MEIDKCSVSLRVSRSFLSLGYVKATCTRNCSSPATTPVVVNGGGGRAKRMAMRREQNTSVQSRTVSAA